MNIKDEFYIKAIGVNKGETSTVNVEMHGDKPYVLMCLVNIVQGLILEDIDPEIIKDYVEVGLELGKGKSEEEAFKLVLLKKTLKLFDEFGKMNENQF